MRDIDCTDIDHGAGSEKGHKLLTTSAFTLGIGLVLAFWMEDANNKDIIAASAAYAAVLVVFVGGGVRMGCEVFCSDGLGVVLAWRRQKLHIRCDEFIPLPGNCTCTLMSRRKSQKALNIS